jgi:hypothetical protein
VALAALVEARLEERGIPGVTLAGGWDGWRSETIADAAQVRALIDAFCAAMLQPVKEGEPALGAVARKLEALARRPLPDASREDAADCTGEAFGAAGSPPTSEEIERWRKSAHGLERVAFATAGDGSLADAAAAALSAGPAWPPAAGSTQTAWTPEGQAAVYDASGEIPPGAARVIVTARTASPQRAIAAAEGLGAEHGALASRLSGLDAPAQLRSVVATAHADGGCVAATLDLGAHELGADAPARIATAAALARQELAVEIADAPAPRDLGDTLATRALDPRDAADRAAWWALAGDHTGPADGMMLGLTVGVAAARDASGPATSVASALRSEIDRATLAWHAPVVEARTRIERGQGEMWLVLASPCGTLPETEGDAGSGAIVASTAAADATAGDSDTHVEPFVAADGVGVLAHSPARAGESDEAQARRIADAAARSYAAQALARPAVRRAEAALLARATRAAARGDATLAGALAPGHPSWVLPGGTLFGLGSASDEAIALRLSSLRAGPLRVAVLANRNASQADAAVRAVDRWIARRPDEHRVCPELPAVATPRPETYAAALPSGAQPSALLAYPVPADAASLAMAERLVGAIDGPDGLLAHALAGSPPLARSSSAELAGAPHAPAIVLRVEADEASLDAAVAQTRALADRLRQGALRDEDRARAEKSVSRTSLSAALDPRARAIALWRGAPAPVDPPSLDTLRTFASAVMKEDSLVIVAARNLRSRPGSGGETGDTPPRTHQGSAR